MVLKHRLFTEPPPDRRGKSPSPARCHSVQCAPSLCVPLSPVFSTLSGNTCVPAPGRTWRWDRGVPEAMGKRGVRRAGREKGWRPAGPQAVRGSCPALMGDMASARPLGGWSLGFWGGLGLPAPAKTHTPEPGREAAPSCRDCEPQTRVHLLLGLASDGHTQASPVGVPQDVLGHVALQTWVTVTPLRCQVPAVLPTCPRAQEHAHGGLLC